MFLSLMFYDATTGSQIDNSCVKANVLSKEHVRSPWRWCETHRNI